MDEPLASQERPQLRTRETILRTPLTTDPDPAPILEHLELAIGKTVEQIVPTVTAVTGHLPDVPGMIRRPSTPRNNGKEDKK